QGEVIGIVRDITDRVRAEEAIQQQAARAEALAHTAARLNAELDLQSVLAAVCEETRRALNVPTVTVSLYNPERDELAYAGGAGVPRGYAEGVRPLRRAEFDAYTRLLGGTIGVVPDVQALPNFHNAGLYVTFDIHTIAAASLRRKSDLIGTLNLVTY